MMVSWWDAIQRLKPFHYGKDTGSWNRAKVLGVIAAFTAIANTFDEETAYRLMRAISAETMLNALNDDKTADAITLREEG